MASPLLDKALDFFYQYRKKQFENIVSVVSASTANPRCESIWDFYFFTIHFSLKLPASGSSRTPTPTKPIDGICRERTRPFRLQALSYFSSVSSGSSSFVFRNSSLGSSFSRAISSRTMR